MTMPSWAGVKGATQAAVRWAGGDRADDATVEHRRAACRDCPSRVRHIGVDFCGEAFVDRMDEVQPTCGCSLVKVFIESESCPQGRWQ